MKRVVNIVLIEDNCLLIVRDREGVFWTLPGGKVEEKETLLSAIRREIKEELPFVEITNIFFYKRFLGVTPHSESEAEVFVFLGAAKGTIETGAEITGSQWVDSVALKNITLSTITKNIIEHLFSEGRL